MPTMGSYLQDIYVSELKSNQQYQLNFNRMKAKLMLFGLLMCSIFSSTAFAQTNSVSKDDALAIAQRQFQGKDVDYFILESSSTINWTVFVDAEPMKGWEHDCYVLTIPKNISTSLSSAIPTRKVLRRLPPAGNYVPLSVKNRYSTNANVKPVVSKSNLSNSDLSVAQRTYAIILSGGVNKMSNYERYWNDCSFVYQTLVNKYGIPKENIVPIMSDGNNPAEDMKTNSGTFKSQPLDLDNDGIADISLAATKSNITTTLNDFADKMKKDDHLLFYVIDHGGTDDDVSDSYICLWNYEYLYDHELASLLSQFTSKFINVNVVLGQCYSGGFNNNLNKVGCVVSSACSGSEYSWACPDIPYDEFVYQWTCAVNGADHRKVKVNADYDNNGRVTMLEAFEYAKSHDRRDQENPQYISTPLSVGEDLSFNNLAPSIDLYVKDNPEDTGKEPNLTTDKFWLSPSIWVRNVKDGIYEHENPIYSEDHPAAFIYVRVHNRGKETYEGGTQYVHLYYAKASTGFKPDAWMGNETYNNGEVTGGPIRAVAIPRIEAGDSCDVVQSWALPDDLLGTLEDNYTEKHHFCLLAHITNSPVETWNNGTFSYNVKNSNKDAQKNVSIISQKELNNGTSVFVRNIFDSDKKYSLELIPRTEYDEAIYAHANIEMELSQQIYNSWSTGGSNGNNVSYRPSAPRIIQFTSKDSRLEAISMKDKEFDKVTLRFNFKSASPSSPKYTLDLVQKDEEGNIVGGETFIVESPTPSQKTMTINTIPTEDKSIKLSSNAEDSSMIRWENNYGETISREHDVKVNLLNGNNTYHVYAINENGELSNGTISLDSNMGISNISKNSDKLTIMINENKPFNSYLSLTSTLSGEEIVKLPIEENTEAYHIDISELAKGIYIISYISDGNLIDCVKFNI